jgi:cold shock CspA family protein
MYMSKRGFGYITTEGKDGGSSTQAFVHWSAITSSDRWPSLNAGMTVEYNLGKTSDGGLSAHAVTLPGNQPVKLEGEDKRSLSSFRVQGKVKFFHHTGYGFIALSDATEWGTVKAPAGTEIYFSREEIVAAEGFPPRLASGIDVECAVFQPEGKDCLQAALVTSPGNVPVKFEFKPREPKPAPAAEAAPADPPL